MRRAPERRRVRLWEFFRWVLKGICRARRRVSGPGRRTVQFCWAIRRPSTRTMRTRIAACSPKRCSCRAVACGDPGVSCDMGRRPLVRRRWRRGSPFPVRQGMPPPAPRPPRSPRQFRLRSRTLLGPVVPRERSEGSTKLPHCRVRMSLTAVLCRPGASVSIRPCPPVDRAAWRIRADGVHLPMRPAILAHRASRGTWTSAAASYGCRARAGLPPAVCRPVRRASPPDNVAAGPQIDGVRLHPAPRRHQKRMFSSLAAAGRNADIAPRHYRNSAHRSRHRATASQRPATIPGSDRARVPKGRPAGHRPIRPSPPQHTARLDAVRRRLAQRIAPRHLHVQREAALAGRARIEAPARAPSRNPSVS